MQKGNRALDHKCPACRAVIEFKPKLGKWKCDYCDNEYDLEELQKFNNASSKSVNEGALGDDTIYDSYRCKNCGAEIVADEHTASTFCVYCGNTAILKTKLSGKFAPTKIIPFKTVKKDAINAFKKLKKGRPLLPKTFISEENIEKIRGLYVPFWLYDIIVEGEVVATGKKIKSWTSGDRRYTKTDTYNVVRAGKAEYDLIPVDGSEHFADDIMNTIEPFNYSEMVDYNHAYLSGFLSEKYNIDEKSAVGAAFYRAKNSTMDVMRNTMVGYDTINVTSNGLNSIESKHEYALLPVWMVNVKYKDKYYLFAMNGQTGEFIGNMPISVKKTLLFSVCLFVVSFLLCILFFYIMFLGGYWNA